MNVMGPRWAYDRTAAVVLALTLTLAAGVLTQSSEAARAAEGRPSTLLAGVPTGSSDRARTSEESPDEILSRAREAAAEDRHRDAIDLYLRAVERDSTLRPAVSLELGHQYTWAEVPDSAIVWYETYLVNNPGDLDAELGIARAVSWAGRLREAEARYTALLAEGGGRRNEVLLGLAKVKAWQEDYGGAERVYWEILHTDENNNDARLDLGETLNWSGRHRDARSMFETIVKSEPDNAEAIKGLAESDLWIGRPDRAIQTLDRAFEQGVRNDDLDETAAAIRRTRDPRGSTAFSYSKNTDDGEIRTVSTSLTWPLGYLTEVGLAYSIGRLHESGFPDIDRNELSMSVARRFSDELAVTAAPGYQFNRFDPVVVSPGQGEVDEFDLFVWDAYVTVLPRDWVRIDAGTFRETMDIPLPVFKRIRVTTANVGLDWRLLHRLATFWETKYSDYSDGNSRVAALERAEWTHPFRVRQRPGNRVIFIQGVEYSSFGKQLDNGYFCPASYFYAYGGLRFVTDLGKKVNVSLDGRLGGEKEDGNEWASVGAFEGGLRVRITGTVVLTGGYFKSGSRLDSPDGFRADGFFVSLDYGGAP